MHRRPKLTQEIGIGLLALAVIAIIFLIGSLSTSAIARRYTIDWGKDRIVSEYDGAYLEVRSGLPILHLKGDPYRLGKQQGVLLREYLDRGQEMKKRLFGGSDEQVRRRAERLAANLPERYRREVEGLADGAGYTFDQLLFEMARCSQFVALPELTGDKVIHARNMDYYGGAVAQSYIVIYAVEPDQGIPFVGIDFMGAIGFNTGMNAYGLTFGVNSADGPRRDAGLPPTMACRDMMTTCRTIDEALTMFSGASLSGPIIVTVSDPGNAAVLELGAGLCQVREPADGFIVATNHYSPVYSEGLPKDQGSYWRYAALYEELSLGTPVTVERATGLLAKVAMNNAVIADTGLPSSALHSDIFFPAGREFLISMRQVPAAEGEFVRFTLDELLAGR